MVNWTLVLFDEELCWIAFEGKGKQKGCWYNFTEMKNQPSFPGCYLQTSVVLPKLTGHAVPPLGCHWNPSVGCMAGLPASPRYRSEVHYIHERLIKGLKQQTPFLLRQHWYGKNEGVSVAHLYALAGTRQRLRVHSNTPSSHLCRNYQQQLVLKSQERHKRYSRDSHPSLCKRRITHLSVFIGLYIHMYVLAAGAELRNFTDLISVVFPNTLNNQGSR